MLLSFVPSLGEKRDEMYHVATRMTTHIAVNVVAMELSSWSFGVKLCKIRSSGKYGCLMAEFILNALVCCLSLQVRE